MTQKEWKWAPKYEKYDRVRYRSASFYLEHGIGIVLKVNPYSHLSEYMYTVKFEEGSHKHIYEKELATPVMLYEVGQLVRVDVPYVYEQFGVGVVIEVLIASKAYDVLWSKKGASKIYQEHALRSDRF